MSIIAKAGSEICKANTNTSTAKYQYSFSKASRFPQPNLAEEIRTKKLQDKLDKGETLPVPIRKSKYEFYNLPSTLSSRKTTFGKGNKYDFTKVGNNCKESSYAFKSDFSKEHPHGPAYSFTHADRSGKGKIVKKKKEGEEEEKKEKSKELIDPDGPSPARYNYLKPFGYDAPKVSFKGRYTSKKQPQETEPKEDEKKELPQVTIQIRTSGKYVVSQIPNVNSVKFFKETPKKTKYEAFKTPGPQYQIPPLICHKVFESQYRNYEKIVMTGRTNIKDSRSNYPGPGSYPLPSDFGQYLSKDADKYPKENVYVEERPKPKDDKPWRHGMKKIVPKEEIPEEDYYKEDDQNNDNNEGGTPGYEDNYDEQEKEKEKEKEREEEQKLIEDKKKKEKEEKEKEKEKEDKEKEEEEDSKSEVVFLRDLLMYKEGEAKEEETPANKIEENKEEKIEEKKDEKIEEKKEEKTEEKKEDKTEEKKEEDKESEAIMLRDKLQY